MNLRPSKTSLKKTWKTSKWLIAFTITALIGAYLGNVVPKWLADKKVIELVREFSNLEMPNEIRFKPTDSKFPYAFSTSISLTNKGNVDLINQSISIRFLDSSMDCGLIGTDEKSVKAFVVTKDKAFDSDFENFVHVKDAGFAEVYISKLGIDEKMQLVIFSNYAFRTALIPGDNDLNIKSRKVSSQRSGFEDNPMKLMNCFHLTGNKVPMPDNMRASIEKARQTAP